MENRPVFEWIPGKIVLDEQEDEKYFENLINDLQHHHNNDYYSKYLPDGSDGDDSSLGSREAEYSAMDEEEGMIVTYDNICEEGDTSDHEYVSNESEE